MDFSQSHHSCLAKQEEIKKFFLSCSTPEERYQKIIELGRRAPRFPPHLQSDQYLVSGCQSVMHLYTSFENNLLYFQAHSEALVSAGLASLLIWAYDKESPKTVLTCPPLFIEELNLTSSLSPNRSNGLASLHLRMKQEALKYIQTHKK